jgi:hypothetical protein
LEALGGEGGSIRDDIVVVMKLKEGSSRVECGHFKWRLIRPKLISWPYYTKAVFCHCGSNCKRDMRCIEIELRVHKKSNRTC